MSRVELLGEGQRRKRLVPNHPAITFWDTYTTNLGVTRALASHHMSVTFPQQPPPCGPGPHVGRDRTKKTVSDTQCWGRTDLWRGRGRATMLSERTLQGRARGACWGARTAVGQQEGQWAGAKKERWSRRHPRLTASMTPQNSSLSWLF